MGPSICIIPDNDGILSVVARRHDSLTSNPKDTTYSSNNKFVVSNTILSVVNWNNLLAFIEPCSIKMNELGRQVSLLFMSVALNH